MRPFPLLRWLALCGLACAAFACRQGAAPWSGATVEATPPDLAIVDRRAGDHRRSRALVADLLARAPTAFPWAGDARLHTAAWTLLRYTDGLDAHRVDGALTEALDGAGVFDPLVFPVEVSAASRPAALDRLGALLTGELGSAAYNRLGLAAAPRAHGWRAVALLVRRRVEVAVTPRTAPPGRARCITGRILATPMAVSATALSPGGDIVDLPVTQGGGTFELQLTPRRAGTWRISLQLESSPGQPELPAALFSVEVGRPGALAGGPRGPLGGALPRFRVLPATGAAASAVAAQAAMRAWVDDLRDERNLPRLRTDAALDAVAAAHANDLARRRTLAHVDAAGRGPLARLRRAGEDATALGENVASGFTVDGITDRLGRSPTHLRELLRADVTRLGVGVARRDGVLYAVQVFAGP